MVVVVAGATVVVVAGTVVVVAGTVVVVGGTVVVVVGGTVVVVGGTVVVVVGGTVVVVVGATVVVVAGTVVFVVGATVVVVGCVHWPGRVTTAVRRTFWGPGLGQLASTVRVTVPAVVEGSVVVPSRVLPTVGCGGAVIPAMMPVTEPAVTATDDTVMVRLEPETVSEFCTCQVITTFSPSCEQATSPVVTGWCASALLATPRRTPPAMTAVAAT